MNRVLLFLVFYFQCTSGFSQTPDVNDTIYFDRKWAVTSNEQEAAFYRLPRVATDSGYRLMDYFLNGNLQMIGYATTPEAFMRTGYSIVYDSLRFKKEEGTYQKGMKQEAWKYYFPHSGDVKKLVTFQHDEPNGLFISYDSVSRKVAEKGVLLHDVNEGEWISFFRRTNAIYRRTYYRNKHIDSLILYYPNGKLKRQDYFLNDKLLPESACYDSSGKKIRHFPYRTAPVYSSSWKNTWYEEVFYPEVKKGKAIEGLFRVSFIISETGSVTDKQIDSAATPENRQIAQGFLSRMKSWKPARFDSRAVALKMDITVTYGNDHNVEVKTRLLKSERDLIDGD